MSNKVHGNTRGLKPNQLRRIQKIYDRAVDPSQLVSPELARYMVELSKEISRQIGVLIDRRGRVEYVMVGDTNRIDLPDFKRVRAGMGRFRGLRHIHTILDEKGLRKDALVDLALLRLDMVAAISGTDDLLPHKVYAAHLMPVHEGEQHWKELPPSHFSAWTDDFLDFITELESEFSESVEETYVEGDGERAILVGVFQRKSREAEASMRELRELARTAGVHVVKTVLQRQDKVQPKTLIGSGKLTELAIQTMADEVELCIVDGNLSASQAGAIADAMDVKVIDRTQLILEIFAQHANSREGKIQVELAQLRYLLPRLAAKDDSLSRLTGGIGSRGPGETKLEIGRRRTQDRIRRLEKQLKKMSNSRQQRRMRRQRSGIPIVSIVGYTNAGKSTLLNALTSSEVLAEDRLFATLDTASRRLRFPEEKEVIITDTVGFIRDLPPELMAAFKATLEELEDADLLLHVVDASSRQRDKHKASVEEILKELKLASVPRVLVYNKIDLLEEEDRRQLEGETDAVCISAEKGENLMGLLREMETHIWTELASSAIINGSASTANR